MLLMFLKTQLLFVIRMQDYYVYFLFPSLSAYCLREVRAKFISLIIVREK